MSERQVDLGLGQGLKPGALTVPKDGEEESVNELPSKFSWKTFLEEKRARRRSSSGLIDLSRTVVGRPTEESSQISGPLSPIEMSLQLRLQAALQEAEVLRQEVESYRKQLDSKHSAIRILRQQMVTTTIQLDDLNHRNNHMRRDMTTEINRLQFELEYNQNILMESQQTWSQRFDRVCQENVKQQSALNARSDEIRQLTEERKALARDREELLALLDPDKRSQWCASASSIAVRAAAMVAAADAPCRCSSTPAADQPAKALNASARSSIDGGATLPYDVDAGGCSAVELAVLGACSCRNAPCRCAHAAARLKREVVRAREAATEADQRAEDAYVVVDAYRNAFEEQLSRNRGLTLRMGELAANSGSNTSRVARLKALVTWVGRQLHDLGMTSGGRNDGTDSHGRPQRQPGGAHGSSCGPWRRFAIRRASTVEDLGLAAATCRGGANLNTSSWSISESVVSTGILGTTGTCGDEPGDTGCDDGVEADADDDLDVCVAGDGDGEKAYRSSHGNVMASGRDELNEEDLMVMLLEKLCERTESVAHQRITARVLKRPGAASHSAGNSGTNASTSSGVFSAASSEAPSPSS